MGKIIDLTGQRFGKLTVVRITNQRYHRQIVWECKCDCGNTTYVAGNSLRTGHTQSCGCGWYKSKAEDLTGQKFGKLTVLKRNLEKNNNSRHAMWDCQCFCGNIRTVDGTSLRNGNIIECQECARERRSTVEYKLMHPRKTDNLHGPIKDLTGQKFGHLTVLSMIKDKRDNAGHILWQCECDCGNKIEVASNRLTTYNTTSCGCQKKSVGEEQILSILKKNNIIFQRQYKFDDCLSPKDSKLIFDFAIFDNNNNLIKLIEYDGKQHFQPINFFGGEEEYQYRLQCDEIKTNYCKEHNIPLIRIPYTLKNNIQLKDLQI